MSYHVSSGTFSSTLSPSRTCAIYQSVSRSSFRHHTLYHAVSTLLCVFVCARVWRTTVRNNCVSYIMWRVTDDDVTDKIVSVQVDDEESMIQFIDIPGSEVRCDQFVRNRLRCRALKDDRPTSLCKVTLINYFWNSHVHWEKRRTIRLRGVARNVPWDLGVRSF